ncbi:discoidin domain-containing protein [Candidatus Wolfebacteria bacterium]|nr:discoidin domain-containing protein [Candidatus Wolfebacteria bacterium]
MKKTLGFTLIEIVIYVSIFAVVGGLATAILITATKVQQNESASSEVGGQMNFVLQTIQRLVRSSSNIEIEAGIATSSLKLRMADSAKDPTCIYLESGKIKLAEGPGDNPENCVLTAIDLTDDNVVVDSLNFRKITSYPGHDSVSVDIQITYNSESPDSQVERALQTAVSRVSAATFDANILPGSSSYDIGQIGSPWQKIFMANGTAGNPSYTFANSTSLGLFRADDNILGFTTAGVERMRIDASGNITIPGKINNNSIPFSYNSDYWTQSGLVNYNGGNVNNGDWVTYAFHTDSSAEGSYLQLDAQSTKRFTKIAIGVVGGNPTAIWSVQYSDNGSDWTDALAGLDTSKIKNNYPNPTSGMWQWPDIGAHRYWRLYKTNAAGSGGYHTEIQFYEDMSLGLGLTYFDGNVGIGTTSPGAKLEIAGQIKITGGSPGSGKVLTSDADGFAIWNTPGTSPWIINGSKIYYNGGNVGIGTPNPFTALEVAGDISRTCDEGWVWVPGSAKYGTLPGFCVMQYEAKYSSGMAVSQASGNPWVSISQTAAIAECQELGADYHLISEPEWMTIAENATTVASNWSGGSVGSGTLARGWAANTSYGDSWTNTVVAPSTGPSCLYNTDINTCDSSGTHLYRRTLTLTNGNEIWDISGNVWEWTDKTSVCYEQPEQIGSAGSEWLEYNDASGINYKGFSYLRLPNNEWSSSHGIGRIYTDVGNSAAVIRAFHRGGDWSIGSYAGVFTLGLYNAPGSSSVNFGFRCAR